MKPETEIAKLGNNWFKDRFRLECDFLKLGYVQTELIVIYIVVQSSIAIPLIVKEFLLLNPIESLISD